MEFSFPFTLFQGGVDKPHSIYGDAQRGAQNSELGALDREKVLSNITEKYLG
jgi:hypothetical protein